MRRHDHATYLLLCIRLETEDSDLAGSLDLSLDGRHLLPRLNTRAPLVGGPDPWRVRVSQGLLHLRREYSRAQYELHIHNARLRIDNKLKRRGGLGEVVADVLERYRRGGHYATLVKVKPATYRTDDKGRSVVVRPRSVEVEFKPRSVARSLVNRFKVWFGHGREGWDTTALIAKDTRKGRALRRKLARMGEKFDIEGTGLCPEHRPILSCATFSDKRGRGTQGIHGPTR